MNSVNLFFESLMIFLVLLSVVSLATGLITTSIAFRDSRKYKQEMEFNGDAFVISVVLPTLYLIAIAEFVVIQ